MSIILQPGDYTVPSSSPTVYAGLEKLPIGPDNKTPFQWAQPVDTSNPGSSHHGTYSWTPGAAGTNIAIKPGGPYDNFFFYCPVTFPTQPPSRLRWTAGDLHCSDWGKSQQIEWQIEEFRDGWQYTVAWAINARDGLRYWGNGQWHAFPAGANIKSLQNPTFIMGEATLDHVQHSFTYQWIVVNGLTIPMDITCAAAAKPPDWKEYSIAVQLDGNQNAQPYSAVLNNLCAEWQ